MLEMEPKYLTRGAVSPSVGILPSSNYPSHDSSGMVPITVVCLTLSSALLALRMYTRVRILRVFYLEDCEKKAPRFV